jgi:hypothetical protein
MLHNMSYYVRAFTLSSPHCTFNNGTTSAFTSCSCIFSSHCVRYRFCYSQDTCSIWVGQKSLTRGRYNPLFVGEPLTFTRFLHQNSFKDSVESRSWKVRDHYWSTTDPCEIELDFRRVQIGYATVKDKVDWCSGIISLVQVTCINPTLNLWSNMELHNE